MGTSGNALRWRPDGRFVPMPMLLLLCAGSAVALADDRYSPRERLEVGKAARVTLSLSARGGRPGFTPKGEKAPEPAPGVKAAPEAFPFHFDSHLVWTERVRLVEAEGRARRVVRRLDEARGEIDFFRGAGQKLTVGVRPDLELLVAERRPGEPVVVASLGGPLTRPELDLIQTVGDPLTLGDLLPDHAVAVGDRWELGNAAARALTEYDVITTNALRGKLEAADEKALRFSIVGEVRGSVRGAEGSVALAGEAVFDRAASLVSRLTLERAEARLAGPVESALDVKSTLKLERTPIDVPAELADTALEGLPLEPDPQRELLLLEPPGGSYTLLHDRQWHIVNDTVKRVVLRRMRGATLEGQCDLVTGPNAGKGRHQDLTQFRDDIRKGLRGDFASVVGEGELGGSPEGGFRYKLAVEGGEKETGVVPLWYYYLVAGPNGDQVVAIFTLSRETEGSLADQDERMIGSLKWKAAVPSHPAEPAPSTPAP